MNRIDHHAISYALLTLLPAIIMYPCRAEAVVEGGVVSGFVEYGGAPPPPAPVAITKDREVCGTKPVYDQTLVVGPHHGLANVVVAIMGVAPGPPLTPTTVRFEQRDCQYIPHVLVFPAGSTVVIINSDGILHNIHTESSLNPVIDLAQPGFKKQIYVTIEKPEVIKVTCDAHNWMEGWWYVTATPYYAVTDSTGRYVIHGIPPGTYTLQVWQERLGTQSQNVVVRPGAATVANFSFGPLKTQGS
jgi:plastocyanin